MGGKVLLFMSFLVYRGAFHTNTHTRSYKMHLNRGSRRTLVQPPPAKVLLSKALFHFSSSRRQVKEMLCFEVM